MPWIGEIGRRRSDLEDEVLGFGDPENRVLRMLGFGDSEKWKQNCREMGLCSIEIIFYLFLNGGRERESKANSSP